MYSRKIRLVALLAVGVSSGAAMLALWSVRASDQHIKQADVAHGLLSEHLQLSVRAYRLFKQLTDEILLGAGANQAIVRNKRAAIAESLARIRLLEIEQRNALGAAAPPGAVEDTDALEELIDVIVVEFESLQERPAAERRPKVSAILEDLIDVSFREAVNTALERQENVVTSMNLQISRVHARLVGASITLALLSVIAAWGSSQLLTRGISRPLKALQQGAQKLGQGDFDARVPEGFDAEFAQMAQTFNGMAGQLAQWRSERESEQRRLELAVQERTSELTEANTALQHADQVRRHFFADVSHELRTPLTVIRGEAQVALRADQRSSDEYREALQTILDQSVGLSRLVEDMLFIARTDGHTIRLRRETFDLVELSEDVVRELRHLADDRNVCLQLLPPDGPTEFRLDPDRIRQLLIILIDNALRFAPRDSEVCVRWEPEAGGWRLSVEDQGPGIHSQDLPYIFDRFFRGQQASPADSQGGMGLGLAVAKAIVQAHEGDIRADNRTSGGCRLLAYFPEVA